MGECVDAWVDGQKSGSDVPLIPPSTYVDAVRVGHTSRELMSFLSFSLSLSLSHTHTHWVVLRSSASSASLGVLLFRLSFVLLSLSLSLSREENDCSNRQQISNLNLLTFTQYRILDSKRIKIIILYANSK